MPISNIPGRQINVENTYSIKDLKNSKKYQQFSDITNRTNRNNNINNENFSQDNIKKSTSYVSEDKDQSGNIKNITDKIQSKTSRREVSELKESVKKVESDQIKNIEETNTTIANNVRMVGIGGRLINNFLTNLTPNIGGKIDTVA